MPSVAAWKLQSSLGCKPNIQANCIIVGVARPVAPAGRAAVQAGERGREEGGRASSLQGRSRGRGRGRASSGRGHADTSAQANGARQAGAFAWPMPWYQADLGGIIAFTKIRYCCMHTFSAGIVERNSLKCHVAQVSYTWLNHADLGGVRGKGGADKWISARIFHQEKLQKLPQLRDTGSASATRAANSAWGTLLTLRLDQPEPGGLTQKTYAPLPVC